MMKHSLLNKVAVIGAVAGAAMLTAGAANAFTYNGTTLNELPSDTQAGSFDFSRLRPYGDQYGGVGSNTDRQFNNGPGANGTSAFTFSFNDLGAAGLSAGDTVVISNQTISLGNIGGGNVTLTLGTGSLNTLTVGNTDIYNGAWNVSPDGSGGLVTPTRQIGGQLGFTISRDTGGSFSGVFDIVSDEIYNGAPANGIYYDAATNTVAVWIRGLSTQRMCEWTGSGPWGCGGMLNGVSNSASVDLAEDLFYGGSSCNINDGHTSYSGDCQHPYKKQYVKLELGFSGTDTPPPPGGGGIPEPMTLAVFGLGLAGIGYTRRRKAPKA